MIGLEHKIYSKQENKKLENIINKYSDSLILVFGDTNDLLYFQNNKILFKTKCATGKKGFGNEKGSYKTPLGLHKISGLYGDKMDITTIFQGRKPIGNLEYYPDFGKIYPVVLTRIIQLDGLEEMNLNTKERFIYIHGTPNIWYWETEKLKRTYGCISLRPWEIIPLFYMLKKKKETFVYVL